MENLRIIGFTVIDESNVDIYFSHPLSKYLNKNNVQISSEDGRVPNPEIKNIYISENKLTVNCQPLTPLYSYYFLAKSIPDSPFNSSNDIARLVEDNVSNKYLFLGPVETDNLIKSSLKNYLRGSIYNIDNEASVVSKHIDNLSLNLSRALVDINQAKNDNYISFDIENEKKTRGSGPFDRLNEEGAYELTRLSFSPSANRAQKLYKTLFDANIFSLQWEETSDTCTPGTEDEKLIFNTNTLILNLNQNPIIKVKSISMILNNSSVSYTYDINKFGYEVLNSKYFKYKSFNNTSLKENQIKLNFDFLKDVQFSVEDIISVNIIYDYKNISRIIDKSSIKIFSSNKINYETLPPIKNVFNLKHAPIINDSNEIPKINGAEFHNLYDLNSNQKHPAFQFEMEFNPSALPFSPGQYSIDYATGTVYVYGGQNLNNGTGEFPPVISYNYQFSYEENLDFTIDFNSFDLSPLPFGNLIDNVAFISFEYEEQNLVIDKDYVADLHKEVLNETVNNKLFAVNGIKTNYFPITNVFRIFNQTSGEIYTIDRWEKDRVYYNYINPPTINKVSYERTEFDKINNENIYLTSVLTNTNSDQIIKILLKNSQIVSATDDSIASSINTSLTLSNADIFINEKYFDKNIDYSNSLNKLLNIGDYCVDYAAGIIYLNCFNIPSSFGTASYKYNSIKTNNKHVLSVEDIFYQKTPLEKVNKNFSYDYFTDDLILVSNLDISDEKYLNNQSNLPYQLVNDKISVIDNFVISNHLSNDLKFIRGVFSYDDLSNNSYPINFGNHVDDNLIVQPIEKIIFDTVYFDGSHYYVNTDISADYLSSDITYTFEVIRTSDNASLWDGGGIIIPGKPIKLQLSGFNTPNLNDSVKIKYSLKINNLSRLIVDYNKGDLYVAYSYLQDEIIINYEYGDNSIDFRKTNKISEGQTYYVSYKAGALRSGLYSNFGNLLNIDELSNFDPDFDRERYRDALNAALGSFLQGPTIAAIKNIGKNISHAVPEIKEDLFEGWSLGNSLLSPEKIISKGNFKQLPGKFKNGVLINEKDQVIKLTANSNLKIEEGTFECGIIPHWNGIDNQSELSFEIKKGNSIISDYDVFVGNDESHPTIIANKFKINKNSIIHGKPEMNKDGIFIYYDKDISEKFSRWYIEIIDGYVSPNSPQYDIKIESNGTFYDTKLLTNTSSNCKITTGLNKLTIRANADITANHRITFISNIENYIFDYGYHNKNRISLYKDVSGYLIFRVIDSYANSHMLSADVSSWNENDFHQVACSWKLNSQNNKDEMHLFVDGFEVPNIIKYNQSNSINFHAKFKAVNGEEISFIPSKDIVSSNDLQTIAGSNQITSSLNFSSYNLNIGDSIIIEELGFDGNGYTISSISGQTLVLNVPMPLTINGAKFTINQSEVLVSSTIDIFSKFAVFRYPSVISGNDLSVSNGSNIATSVGSNFNIVGIKPGDLLKINNNSFEKIYTIVSTTATTLILDKAMEVSSSGLSFSISTQTGIEITGPLSAKPSYQLNKINNSNYLLLKNNVFKNDLLMISTYGLNFNKIKSTYYSWSDGYENILKTKMLAPISLDQVKIKKIILNTLSITPSNSIVSAGQATYSNIQVDDVIDSINGRTLEVFLSGSNISFSNPTSITIDGEQNGTPISEIVNFTSLGSKFTTNKFTKILNVDITTTPIDVNKSSAIVKIAEKNNITEIEDGYFGPTIRYGYSLSAGTNLSNSGTDLVQDLSNNFSDHFNENSYLFISSPPSVYGFYSIESVLGDKKTLKINPINSNASIPLPNFSGGSYQVINVSNSRSGFQNGFIVLEDLLSPGKPYFISKGTYDISYYTYLNIDFKKPLLDVYFGSSIDGKLHLNGVLDQVNIYSNMIGDTRTGEVIAANAQSITKNYNSISPNPITRNMLASIDFEEFPFENKVNYFKFKNKFIQSSTNTINSNFNNNVVIKNNPLVISNDGILDTSKESSIEFWTSPFYDTYNDPNERFYFDATSAIVEEMISDDISSIKTKSMIDKVLSVNLVGGDQSINYFVGGKLEIDNNNAIVEQTTSLNNFSAEVGKSIFQVISVKILGDLSETDYFQNGSFDPNGKIIYLGKSLPISNALLNITYKTSENTKKANGQVIKLGKKLPNHQSKVSVVYLPKGNMGGRISILKDKFGFLNFRIFTDNKEFLVRAPINWSSGSWHRIKASFKINGGKNSDEMRLFIDGYQYSNVLYGSGILYNESPYVYGQTKVGDGYTLTTDIKFKDVINTLYVGSDFTKNKGLFGVIDNFKISNVSRDIYSPFGEPRDPNYNSNLNIVLPVVKDLYTTFLLDFENDLELTRDFAVLKNKKGANFNFEINIFDSFDIVNSNPKSKNILEILIKKLKPATSKVLINYI